MFFVAKREVQQRDGTSCSCILSIIILTDSRQVLKVIRGAWHTFFEPDCRRDDVIFSRRGRQRSEILKLHNSTHVARYWDSYVPLQLDAISARHNTAIRCKWCPQQQQKSKDNYSNNNWTTTRIILTTLKIIIALLTTATVTIAMT
jgi:hypothetical protein